MSRDRDHLFERTLQQQMRADTLVSTPQCLDAEALAAWADGGLDAAAMQAAEIHTSTCVRCQSLLAVIAKATPATGALIESKRFLSWHWWLAPMAAAAAAVTMWMVVPEQQQQIAIAPSSAIAPAPDAELQEKPRSDTVERSANRPNQAAKTHDNRRERQADPSPKEEQAGTLVARESAVAVTSTDAAAPAARPAPPASPAVGAFRTSQAADAAPFEIVSPDALRRWRAVPDGIESSTDRGVSWMLVRPAGGEKITGGVAVSGSICWLIGRAGAVLVTIDGMNFTRVDLPVRVDITSITATDARLAVVTTTEGRTFRTDDSGRNWRQN